MSKREKLQGLIDALVGLEEAYERDPHESTETHDLDAQIQDSLERLLGMVMQHYFDH